MKVKDIKPVDGINSTDLGAKENCDDQLDFKDCLSALMAGVVSAIIFCGNRSQHFQYSQRLFDIV